MVELVNLLQEEIPRVKKENIGNEIYSTLEYKERYQTLSSTFEREFQEKPKLILRSPGRVNLIGEHIDYSGYSVLPMAIERDSVMALSYSFGSNPPTVELVNVDQKYPKRVFNHEKNGHVTIDPTIHEWSNYFKCGYKGVLDELNPDNVASLKIAVDGIVPTGSGLSSSSAFVCCSSLTTLFGNQQSMTKGELTKTAIKSETYAGVQIGGMDQSISIMAPKDSALLIDFYPSLNAKSISIPTGTSPADAPMFVIANTMVTADKHVTAPKNYNLRVVECRLAAAILAKKLGLTQLLALNGPFTLKQVHEAAVKDKDLSKTFQVMIEAVEKYLEPSAYTVEKVAQVLEESVEAVSSKYIASIKVYTENGFKLFQRAKHVFEESERVYLFKDACLSENKDKFLKAAGDLMNASHMSCKTLFECSCAELDELTELCRSQGAFGSRLTGAGWGGCTVSLVTQEAVPSFIEHLRENYYFKKFPEWRNDKAAFAKLDGFLFASPPGIGACVIELD